MTNKEKEDHETYETTGGYLKVNESTFNNKEVTKEDREYFEALPNFCPEILKECTGIHWDIKKVITIDGKDIEISAESFEAFRSQFLKE